MKEFLKAKVLFVLLLSAFAMTTVSCTKYRDIKVISCKLDSVSPKGLKSAELDFNVAFRNPAQAIAISDIYGTVFRQDREIGYISADPFEIPGRGDSEAGLKAKVSLVPSLSVMEALSLFSDFKPEDYTVDIMLKIKIKGGISKKLALEDVPVADLAKMMAYEKF